MTSSSQLYTDEDLTAFLDGEADPVLSRKITTALQDDAMLQSRCDALQAPIASLRTTLDLAALQAPSMPRQMQLAKRSIVPRIGIAAAIAASFALGMIASPGKPAPNWIDQVASYQALYVAETLTGPAQDTGLKERAFDHAQAMLGSSLTAAPVIVGMTFKRAQILAVNGQTLLQIAYLADDGTPYALCLTQVTGADQGLQAGMSHDLSMASWVKDGLGYVLIGGSDPTRLTDLANGLAQTL